MSDFGEIFLSIDGVNIPIKGSVNFTNLNLGEKAVEANADGSMHTSWMPMVPTAEIDGISASAIPLVEIIAMARRCSGEDGDTGISAIFGLSGGCSGPVQTIVLSNAQLIGKIDLAGSTGEISGLSIASSDLIIDGKFLRGLR